jgi:hypothetical protein
MRNRAMRLFSINLIRLAACRALVLLAIFLLSMGVASAQDNAAVRGELRDDFGRLVLDWGRATPPGVTIELTATEMVLRFDRPVRLDASAARANLKAYFRDADLAADGKSLVLPLKKPVTYRASRDGSRLTLDLGQPGEAVFNNDGAALAAAAPPPAGAAAPEVAAAPAVEPDPQQLQQAAAPVAGPKLSVRTGEHAGYSRLALDWPAVDFTLRQAGEVVELTFSKSANVDTAAVLKRLPPRLRTIEARRDDKGNLVLALQVQPNVTATSFRNGATVVLDLKDGAPPPAAAEAPAATPPSLVTAAPTGSVPAVPAAPAPEVGAPEAAAPADAAPQAEAAAPADAAPQTEAAAEPVPAIPSDIPLPALQSAPPVGEMPAEAAPGTPPAPEIATPVVVTQEPAVTPSAQPPAPVAIAARATPSDNGTILDFAFPEPTGLAVFKRGESLWLVFGRPGPVDLDALIRAAPVLTGLARVETPYATVLRLPETGRLGGDKMGATVAGDGRNWQISLGPNRSLRPAGVLEQRRETLGNGGTSLLLQVSEPGAAIDLADPEAGDRLAVIPVTSAGLGLAEAADWPDFRMLASFQGVAVIPISERTRVESLPNGVVVTTVGEIAPKLVAETEPPPAENGQAAAPAPVTDGAATEDTAPAPEGHAPPAELVIAPVAGLFDLPNWRRGGEASFFQDDRDLRAAVEAAPPSQKPAANLALAQFRFAHGRNTETIEALDQLNGTPLENDRLAHALRGAALALMGRAEDALAELDRPDLSSVPEAALFRGYLAAKARDWPKAAEVFGAPLPVLDDYPKPARMELRRAGAEALITEGDPLTAQTFLDGMRLDSPSAEEQAFHDYLSGRQQLRLGNKDAAGELWRKLIDSPVPEVRARSQFDLTEMELADGKIDARQAASSLEALRFVWRGTDFEFDLLRRLGELYLESDQPRRGLTTLRQAATNFPTNPKAKSATDLMAQAFRDLYLGNRADQLPPLTAVALYDEFRELTPSGIDGDRMITALADRLVKVDLLDGAARLLQNQVTKRLAGIDKAEAGTRWAAVSLLDNKPEQALVAIKESEIPDMPPDLVSQRRRLQGRALFETGDTLQGLALIRGDNSLDGLWLKADLQWRLREWPSAATALDDLIRAEAARLQLDLPSEPTSEDVAADPAAALVDPIDSEAVNTKRDEKFTEVLAPLILNQATALSLANDRGALRRLARAHGKQMAKGPYATAFATLTSPNANLADSITAAMQSVDQLGAFVEDYRTRLRDASLSAPAEPSL